MSTRSKQLGVSLDDSEALARGGTNVVLDEFKEEPGAKAVEEEVKDDLKTGRWTKAEHDRFVVGKAGFFT